ncbi:MAG: hypothetical protein LBI69_04510 [Puniceicoccales bacterium]|jgi:hypothetical protein|nr:hypothetical protein [Puniceicoccales bacterium]
MSDDKTKQEGNGAEDENSSKVDEDSELEETEDESDEESSDDEDSAEEVEPANNAVGEEAAQVAENAPEGAAEEIEKGAAVPEEAAAPVVQEAAAPQTAETAPQIVPQAVDAAAPGPNSEKNQEQPKSAVAKEVHKEERNQINEKEPSPEKCKLFFYVAISALTVATIFGIWQFRRISKRFEDQRFLRDIMVIQEALAQYADQGDGNAISELGDKSAGMRDLSINVSDEKNWHIQQTQHDDGHTTTEIIINDSNRTLADMERLDAQLDDGNLSTGNFILKGKDSYAVRILETSEPRVSNVDEKKSDSKSGNENRDPVNLNELDHNYLLTDTKTHSDSR